jgi:hypothetical protein
MSYGYGERANYTQRSLTWTVQVTDPNTWKPEHRRQAEACLEAMTYEDWVMRELQVRMEGAAEAFMWHNPDLFWVPR